MIGLEAEGGGHLRSGGCIVNIASAAGFKPVAGNAVYGTSKAAILFLTRVAAAVPYLVSDDARHVTGADLPVDSGFANT